MSTLTTSAVRLPEPVVFDPLRLRRFSVAEYDKMVETGILTPDSRVELLEGWIVKKTSPNPPHRGSVSRVIRWLGRILPENWSLGCQAPITLSASEPEPDIYLARGEQPTTNGIPGPRISASSWKWAIRR